MHEVLGEDAGGADHECNRQDPRLGRLCAVAVAIAHPSAHAHADERHRRAAEKHPAREPCLDRSERAVADRADGLEQGAVNEIGADCDGRLEAEHDHEQRRHERAASHARGADERPDQQPAERKLPGHEIGTGVRWVSATPIS
jgi:hypothetical protein